MNGNSIDLPDFVKIAIDQVINSSNCSPHPEVIVSRGSQAGDGYTSKTVAITIKDDKQVIPLFIKYFPEDGPKMNLFVRAFEQETNFYGNVYPALKAFQQDRGVNKPFDNVPKYYPTKTNNDIEPIVLENLRERGYTLRSKKERIDEDHVRLALKTFAKFHAVSYTLKDQDAALFSKLSSSMADLFTTGMAEAGMEKALRMMIEQFVKNLNPVEDKTCLEFCKGLDEKLINFCFEVDKLADQYSAITQGDCWSNNMMFLYNKDNTVQDVKLIDWQITRVNSPVLDITYFFYSVATKQMMNNVDAFMEFYHNALSQSIRDLGSNPEILYPYEIFRKHWNTFSKFGLAMSFLAMKGMLCDEDEVVNLLQNNEDGEIGIDAFAKTIKNQDEYQKRMKDILQHFMDNNLM